MQLGPLLESLELGRTVEVPLHHIEEAIVVLSRTSRVLHQESSGISQTPTHLAAQITHFSLLRFQVETQIYHRQLHFRSSQGLGGRFFLLLFLGFRVLSFDHHFTSPIAQLLCSFLCHRLHFNIALTRGIAQLQTKPKTPNLQKLH